MVLVMRKRLHEAMAAENIALKKLSLARVQRCHLGPRIGMVWYQGPWLFYARDKSYQLMVWERGDNIINLEIEMINEYRRKYVPIIERLEEEYYTEMLEAGRVVLDMKRGRTIFRIHPPQPYREARESRLEQL